MKVIFLDIDGVLQPKTNKNRFEHINEMDEIIEKLNISHPIEKDWKIFTYDYDGIYDIAAVMFDWDKKAIKLLYDILESTGAKIVLSSNWKEKGDIKMKALFSLHGLDNYFYDSTFCIEDVCRYGDNDTTYLQRCKIAEEKTTDFRKIRSELNANLNEIYPKIDNPGKWPTFVDIRTIEIREYLDRHSEITSYVTIDDNDIEYGLDGHGVTTKHSKLEEGTANKCKDILAKEDGPYTLPSNCKTKALQEWRDKWIY